ncbi:MAG: hypothetical protein WD716_01530 [Fimbriimonadaceae bacterium]
MGQIQKMGSGAARLALTVVALSVAAASFAQFYSLGFPTRVFDKTTKHAAGPKIALESLSTVNTYSFFPAIDNSIGQKAIRPRPREANRPLPVGRSNRLIAGSTTSQTNSNTGALFPGIQFTGLVPPDCSAAVGLGHIVQTVNSRIAFYDKVTELATFLQNSTQFFAGLPGVVSFQFDPRAIYDQYNDRFIIIFLAQDDGSSASQVLIAVSDDGDPNGNWNRFLLDTSVTIGGTDSWLDYPMVGHTEDALVISGNMFGFGGGPFTGIQSFVISLADLYANTGVTSTPFTVTGQGFNLQPGETYTPGATTVFGISLNTTTSVRLWAFTGLDTATPALASTTVAVPSFGTVGAAPSGSVTFGIDTISGRTMDAVSRGTRFLGAHTIQAAGPTKSSIRWYEFEMGTWPTAGSPTVVQQGNITLPGNQWACMPAISKNADDSISVLYTRSSSSIVSDLVVSSRSTFDPLGTMGAPTLIKQGIAPNAAGRWGDYFTVAVDPNDDRTFWGHGMVTRSDGLWATEISSWTVSRVTQTLFDPVSISTLMGTHTGGGLAQILSSDNAYYDVSAVLASGIGFFASNQIEFTVTTDPALTVELLFTLEAQSNPTETVTGTVFLWNWNTGQFEIGNSFSLKPADNTFTCKLTSNLQRYISGGGQVRIAFRAHDPFRHNGARPQAFQFRTDLVKLQVSHIVP